jgi:hypothetical protein
VPANGMALKKFAADVYFTTANNSKNSKRLTGQVGLQTSMIGVFWRL